MSKILIVDDSLFLRMVLKDILSGRHEIIEADSGHTALEKFSRAEPDMVLLDIIMPAGEEEGIRVLRKIMEKAPQTPVVMISAVGQETVVEECKRLGAADYIAKPFDPQQVAETVDRCLGTVHSRCDAVYEH